MYLNDLSTGADYTSELFQPVNLQYCSVRSRSRSIHFLPFSLLPIIRTYVSRQGVLSLWKGLSGAVTVKVVKTVSENGLSEVLSLPKEITIYSSAAKISLHVLLKVLSWMIVTPFYAASIVEFVQSDIASEPTTLVSCLQEGLRRLLPNISPTVSRMGSVGGKLKAGLRAIPIRTSRLLPVWQLMLPVVALGVGQHIIHSFVSFGVSAYLGRDQEPEQLDAEVAESCNIPDASSSSQKGIDGNDRTLLTSHRREKMLQVAYSLFTSDLTADFVASLTSEAILFPLETIAVRLCVQGTRTLVDNLDTGDSVIPIITSFDGPFDVLRHSSSSASGFIGLYRGFGALILQYGVQLAFLIGVKYAYERIFYYSSPTSTQPPPPPIGRSSMPSDYEPTNQHPSSFQSPFYSTVPNLLDHQPTTSVWQPNLDSERWRTSDPNLNSKNGAPLVPNRSSFVFRGYSPGPFDAPL
ncbi:Mitochondrial substrate solute carrier [Echinococcus multilocularis]|uniref:Mitochondrial substrate solute carrier n=1 Tax=Echinococcus multilocularis TaxID=6211 RepID=A0A087VXY0_ECHMU|nr:Mitochondrial substrate solute carrier [Echinococcus multilocularis]